MSMEMESLIHFALANNNYDKAPDINFFKNLLTKADHGLDGLGEMDSTQSVDSPIPYCTQGIALCEGANKELLAVFDSSPVSIVSRFAGSNLIVGYTHYASVASAYEDAKTSWAEELELMEIIHVVDPIRRQRTKFKKVVLMDFETCHASIMALITYLKFRQCAKLREILFGFAGRTFVELPIVNKSYSWCSCSARNNTDQSNYDANYCTILTAVLQHMLDRGDGYYDRKSSNPGNIFS